MKEPKIIEIAVAVSSAICYPIMKYPPYLRLYIITSWKIRLHIYIYIWFIYPSNWVHGSTNISAVSRRSLLEELRLHSRDADAHSTRPHENVGGFRKSFVEVTEPKWFPMDQTSIKHPNTWDNAQVLAFFPPDHPVCQFWRPAWQSYTPWPWTAIHVQKPCSWRQVSEKPRMLAWW